MPSVLPIVILTVADISRYSCFPNLIKHFQEYLERPVSNRSEKILGSRPARAHPEHQHELDLVHELKRCKSRVNSLAKIVIKIVQKMKFSLEIWGIEPQTSSMLKKRYTTKPYPQYESLAYFIK